MPSLPAKGTAAAQGFFAAARFDSSLLHFIIDVVLRGDHIAFVAKHALEGSEEYKKLDPAQLATADPGPLTRFLRNRRQVLLEMFLARLIDNFQSYLVDLVRAVLHARPAMLSTRQQTLTLEELLKYERIEDLIHEVIEKRVNALAYEGFGELYSWCAERGLEIRVPELDRDAVVELIATRNVIAHNRGLVDEKYLRTVAQSRFSLGEVRKLHIDDLLGAQSLLHRAVAETDHAAVMKFQIEAAPLVADAVPPPLTSMEDAQPSQEPAVSSDPK
jgi:hypothetical protein